MATIQATNWDRYRRHVSKKIRTTIASLRPTAIHGRLAGPRVLLNSIPKAGTHLLEAVLENMPLMRNGGQRTLGGWSQISPRTLDQVGKIARGQFLNAHLPAHKELLELTLARGIKVLLMIRDPRDVVISHFKYVTTIDLTHKESSFFRGLANDKERLMATIVGVPGIVSPISEVLERFEPWINRVNVRIVRFEDLVGERGGGSSLTQHATVGEIAEFLNLPLAVAERERVVRRVSSSNSSTLRKGLIGSWRTHFSPEHASAFKSIAGEHLVRFGYERSLDW